MDHMTIVDVDAAHYSESVLVKMRYRTIMMCLEGQGIHKSQNYILQWRVSMQILLLTTWIGPISSGSLF